MTSPDLSVVVPSYGGASRLPVLFESLRGQDFAGVWELIVVLDGVVDDSLTVIESVDDLPVRVVMLDENRGRSAALNAGFAAAIGGVLIRCDDDLEVPPHYLSTHHQAHMGATDVGAIGLCHDALDESAYARVYGRPANERLRTSAYALDPEGWWKFWAANCSIPRAIFDQVGPYDESFREYGWEDVDWGYRLSRLGVPVVLDRKLEVIHHAASASSAVRVHRAYAGGRAHAHFDRKHGLPQAVVRPTGLASRAWNAAVSSAVRLRSEQRFVSLAAQVDRILDAVPASVGARLVAFLVESSAIAGYQSLDE